MTESYFPKHGNSGPAPEVTPPEVRRKKCCRCFPVAVSKSGLCRCCLFNHATGKSEDAVDPDYDL